MLDAFCDGCLDLGFVGALGNGICDFGAVFGSQLFGRIGQASFGAPRDEQLRALLGECACNAEADSFSAAGDDGNLFSRNVFEMLLLGAQ